MQHPKLADTAAWQQAELLMQPIFIRLIDNLRKQLEQSSWRGTYEESAIWAEGTSEEAKAQVATLQQQLKTATPEQAEDLQRQLAELPSSYPSYVLRLTQDDRQILLDLWQMCYQICFRNYSPIINTLDRTIVVEVDTSLIDEFGEVDWQRLETKTKRIVEQFFANLPVQNTQPQEKSE